MLPHRCNPEKLARTNHTKSYIPHSDKKILPLNTTIALHFAPLSLEYTLLNFDTSPLLFHKDPEPLHPYIP